MLRRRPAPSTLSTRWERQPRRWQAASPLYPILWGHCKTRPAAFSTRRTPWGRQCMGRAFSTQRTPWNRQCRGGWEAPAAIATRRTPWRRQCRLRRWAAEPKPDNDDARYDEQSITAYLSKILPPALVSVLENSFSISSYTPLISKLVEWVGRNPYRILLVVTMGKLLLVVLVAVLAFMTFFFTATASAILIILAGILFVTASTVAVTCAIVNCSFATAILWKGMEKEAPVAKKILTQAESAASNTVGTEPKDKTASS